MSRGPLAGIRVVDFGRFIAGPYCSMLLADMGADVVRVDRRQGSEDRYIGPVANDGHGGHYLSLNRNKRSLTLDLSKAGSAGIIERLARSADVVIANLPVAVLKKMRIDFESVQIIGNDMFARWARLVGREDLIVHPDYADDALRQSHRTILDDVMNAWLANRSRAEALALMEAARVPAGPILGLDAVLADPQVK